MASRKGTPYGLYRIILQLTGASGLSYGQSGSGLANGSTSNAYMIEYPKSASLPAPERTTVDFSGGDKWIGSVQFGINAMPSWDFTVADIDADLKALTNGSSVDTTTNSQWVQSTSNELEEVFPQCSLMVVYRMQSTEAATFGQTYYVTRVFPRAAVSYRGNQTAYQAAGEVAFQVTPTSTSRAINGIPFSSNINANGNRLASYEIHSDNPLWMVVHRVTGTSASIVSTYKPVTSTVGTAAATKNSVVKFNDTTNVATPGVADTVTVATGTFAVGTALTVVAGDLLAVLHETAYESVA